MSPGLIRLGGLALLLSAGALLISRRNAAADEPPVWPGLALVFDVWAMAMQAGAPSTTALAEACGVAAGPARSCLEAVLAGLRRGDGRAWTAAVGPAVPVTVDAAARAALRSESDGTELAPVLRRLADRERAELASRGLIAARRAAVWAVLPLGLCYLPAYVLLGVVPAVVGLVR